MRFVEFEELKTPRLWLRRITMNDAERYFARLARSEAVTRYMTFAPHTDLSQSIASVEKSLARYETRQAYRWVLDLPGEGLIGVVDLLGFDKERGSCCFAYMLGQAYWGKGYGTEALRGVFRFAFEKLEMERIEADHMADNPASGAVMRKVGMRYIRTDAAKYEKDGKIHDAPVYAITRQEWLEMQ